MTARSPFTVEVPRINAVVPVVSATSPVVPAVVKLTAPTNELVAVPKLIVALLALVVKDEVPEIARATVSVMFPVVAVTLRF